MFQSEPVCILTAGPTIDGRYIEQKAIDDMAELYDPKKYNARINAEHSFWSEKYGSVLSLEARGSELWAVLKPNSKMLASIERDQLLHTSCEIEPNYCNTGKSYLTGLALTDEPASLGTTQIHLSSKSVGDDGKAFLSSGATMGGHGELATTHKPATPHKPATNTPALDGEDKSLFKRLVTFLTSQPDFTESDAHESNNQEDESVDKELKELLSKNNEQNAAIQTSLNALTGAITKLSAVPPIALTTPLPADGVTPPEGETTALEKLTAQVETLSAESAEMKTLLSNINDGGDRTLAGGGEDADWL